MACFHQLVQTLEENFILNRANWLAVARVKQEDVKKKMNKFVKQVKPDDTTSASPTFKTIESDEFKIIIFSNEKKKDEKSDENNFVIKDA